MRDVSLRKKFTLHVLLLCVRLSQGATDSLHLITLYHIASFLHLSLPFFKRKSRKKIENLQKYILAVTLTYLRRRTTTTTQQKEKKQQ
tara:strand:- start:115 stop:378 length:264 start_codon:yes stop_codon:yes gene_type:complete